MRKPHWIRSHHAKRPRRHDLPDYARFPSVHPAGIDTDELEMLRASNKRLETAQYRRIQSNGRHQR